MGLSDESAIYGIKLYVEQHTDNVINLLKSTGIQVIPSPTCFKILHTSFQGSLKDLLEQIPELSHYPVKQYKWWHRLAESIKGD